MTIELKQWLKHLDNFFLFVNHSYLVCNFPEFFLLSSDAEILLFPQFHHILRKRRIQGQANHLDIKHCIRADRIPCFLFEE